MIQTAFMDARSLTDNLKNLRMLVYNKAEILPIERSYAKLTLRRVKTDVRKIRDYLNSSKQPRKAFLLSQMKKPREFPDQLTLSTLPSTELLVKNK